MTRTTSWPPHMAVSAPNNRKSWSAVLGGTSRLMIMARWPSKCLTNFKRVTQEEQEEPIAAVVADPSLIDIIKYESSKRQNVAILTSCRCGDFQVGERNYFVHVRGGKIIGSKSKARLWIDDKRREILGCPLTYGAEVVFDPIKQSNVSSPCFRTKKYEKYISPSYRKICLVHINNSTC